MRLLACLFVWSCVCLCVFVVLFESLCVFVFVYCLFALVCVVVCVLLACLFDCVWLFVCCVVWIPSLGCLVGWLFVGLMFVCLLGCSCLCLHEGLRVWLVGCVLCDCV